MRILLLIAATTFLTLNGLQPGKASAATVVLRWTATGDDSIIGRATSYDLRYNVVPITSTNFGSSVGVAGLAPPAPSGSPESFIVNGLHAGATYYFAIKARDDKGNWSKISNIVARPARSTTDVAPRLAVISFSNPRPNPARSGALFVMQLPASSKVLVEAFDILGRRVRTLADQEYEAGEFSVRWDLYNDQGMRLAPGMYKIRARLGTTTFMRTVAVI